MVTGPSFDRRVRFVVGAIFGAVVGVLYAPSFEGALEVLGIAPGSVPAVLATIAVLSLGCGYMCMKLRL